MEVGRRRTKASSLFSQLRLSPLYYLCNFIQVEYRHGLPSQPIAPQPTAYPSIYVCLYYATRLGVGICVCIGRKKGVRSKNEGFVESNKVPIYKERIIFMFFPSPSKPVHNVSLFLTRTLALAPHIYFSKHKVEQNLWSRDRIENPNLLIYLVFDFATKKTDLLVKFTSPKKSLNIFLYMRSMEWVGSNITKQLL